MRKFPSRKKKLNFLLLIGSCILGGLLILGLIFKSGIFNVKKVEVELLQNLDCANADQIKDQYQFLGQNILTLDNRKIRQKIQDRFVCINEITLTKIIPDKVKIVASSREPFAIMATLNKRDATSSAFLENIATPSADQSLEAFLVDRQGVVFSKNTWDLNLATIFLSDTGFKVGQKLNENTQNSLEILEKIKPLGFINPKTLIFDNFFIIFPSDLNPKMVFRLRGGIDIQIASLQLILEKAKMYSESLEFIDLRFDKPIVKFAPKKN